jgi:hypothetical protein
MACALLISCFRAAALGLAAAVLALAALGAPPARAQQEDWTKIDCAGSAIVPPPGFKANCFEGPFTQTGGQNYACRLSNVSFGFFAEGTEPRFYTRARYPKKSGKVCATIAFQEPVNAMQHVHKFVENEATNWSAMQPAGSDISLMFFDAKNQKRDAKCFTFIKLGPPAGHAGQGRLFTMIGFFCKAPGQPLDAATAAALVNQIQVKTE